MIAQHELERLKRDVDLVALIEKRGVALKRRGRSWQGRCPFHEDGKTPSLSVTPERGLWKCFGCGAGGDAIRFVELHEKVGFREAVKMLGGVDGGRNGVARRGPRNGDARKPPPPAPSDRTVEERKLLARVVDFYRRAFVEDPRGAEYLARERGIRDASVFERFRVGFATGKLREALPDAGDAVEGLQALGVLTARGTELFYGCVVFPLTDARGDVVSLYGRRITEGETRHLYLPGPRRGLFHAGAAREHKELILCEGVIDALALAGAGFTNVLPLDGTEGLREEHLALLRNEGVREAYVAMDGDDAGRRAAARVGERLGREGLRVVVVSLPEGQDPADLVREGGARAMEALLRAADPDVAVKPSMPFSHARHGYAPTAEGFRVVLGLARAYDVRGILRTAAHLRATVRASHEGQLHVDAVDLYAARAREKLARALSQLFGAAEAAVADDLARLLEYAEAWAPATAAEPAVETSPADRDEALRLLRAPDLIDRIGQDLALVGAVGEEDNRLLAYLAAVSRKLDEPLSVLIASRSAAGKSHLADIVTRLCPPEDLRRYTRVTGQALFYAEPDAFRHKVLAIEEAAGAEDAAYSVRTLQSAGELTVAVTTKDPRTGGLRTEEHHVRGPVSFLLTSASTELDPETQSRFLILAVDESREATDRILHAQRESLTVEGLSRRREADLVARRHHAMQRLIEPVAVVVPFAPRLRFPAHSLRTRRDHKKYLALIQTVALVHQHQRERKTAVVGDETVTYIEATPGDLAVANRLARAAFARTLDELSPQARALLGEIRTLCEAEAHGEVLAQYTFRRRDLRRRAAWSETQLRQHLGELETHELVEPIAGRQGKEYVYHLAYDEEGRPLRLDLVSAEELGR